MRWRNVKDSRMHSEENDVPVAHVLGNTAIKKKTYISIWTRNLGLFKTKHLLIQGDEWRKESIGNT